MIFGWITSCSGSSALFIGPASACRPSCGYLPSLIVTRKASLTLMHQRATRLTSAPFRVQAPGLVCGQLYEHDRIWRVRSPVLAFLSPFGCRRSLLGHPVPSRGSASLAVGLPAAGQSTGPERGFHVPHW